jgi:hypothetical protein
LWMLAKPTATHTPSQTAEHTSETSVDETSCREALVLES